MARATYPIARGKRATFPPAFWSGDKADRDEREAEENAKEEKNDEREEKKEEGRVLIVIKNLAPERTSMHSSKDDIVAFCLSDEAFQRGAFKYDLRIDVRKAGKVEVRGYVIPFLAPVAGQEFPAH
jgi:hypothetical protein